MSNVKKPEPVAWVIYEPISNRHILSEVELKTKYLDDGTIAYSVSPVVFQSQSEAYANALAAERVREALKEAASILDRMYVNALKAKVPTAEDDEAWNLICTAQARSLTEAQLEVKALIPKQ